MKYSEKVMCSLLDCLKNGLETFEAFELALQLLAWAKLSEKAIIPQNFCISDNLGSDSAQKLLKIFQQLSALEELGDNKAAFELSTIANLKSDVLLTSASGIATKAAQSGVLDHFEVDGLAQKFLDAPRYTGRNYMQFLVPSEIFSLMLKLAGDVAGQRVYCPYDMHGLLALQADRDGGIGCVESSASSPMPWLVNILADASLRAQFSDPVKQPSYLKAGQLEPFKITLAFPPFGDRYDKKVLEQDWFNRFPERTASGAVLPLRHIIAQTQDRAVIAVSQSILFSRGAEHSLRQDLIEKGMIEAVINLPPALLPFTAVQFSILILKMGGGKDTVRFVDGSNNRFFERDNKNRSKLSGWEALLDAFYHSSDDEIAINVPCQNIAENDYHLEVSRYLLSPEQKQAEEYFQASNLKASKVYKLDELVTFVRPSKKVLGDSDLMVFEVSVADFPEFGYLQTPQRSIPLSDIKFSAKEKDTFLQAGDVLIATKGSVGKVAIVPDNVPSAGADGWVVNQSCMIMRAGELISPRTLFMYLRSDVGQTLLEGIVSGATIPMIQLSLLKKLSVIVPTKQKQAKEIEQTFAEIVNLQSEIEALHHKQKGLSKHHWGIQDLK